MASKSESNSGEEVVSSQSAENEENSQPMAPLVGGSSRSGRVRKAKVVFDPSDTETAVKRKSTSAITNDPKVIKESKASDVVVERRKTIAVDENGCEICSRSDTKKGRFVNCTLCSTRGHFTCLRSAKLISNACDESHWQCSRCLKCSTCSEANSEPLFKCVSCFNSFHLNCLKGKPTAITKKKFKCDNCVDEADNTAGQGAKLPHPKKIKKKSADGFAGFTTEDTTRDDNDNAQPNSERTKSFSTTTSVRMGKKRSSSTKSDSVESVAPMPVSVIDLCDEEIHPKIEPNVKPYNEMSQDFRSFPSNSYNRSTFFQPHEDIPDVKKWDCDEVYTFFLGTMTAEYAQLFRDNQIDGDALLLIKREDVLNRFNLKLGPALRLYAHIVALQSKHNNPILSWNEI